MTIILYHNPKCSTSRRTLALLESQGIHPTIVVNGERAAVGRPPENVLRILKP